MKKFEIEKLANLISEEREYESIISHTELAEMMGVQYPSKEYFYNTKQLKKLLLQKGKALEAVYKQGYMIANPDSYSGMAIGEFKKGFKCLDRGAQVLAYAPVKDMSEEGRETYRLVKDRTTRLHASLASGVVELQLIDREKKHPLFKKDTAF